MRIMRLLIGVAIVLVISACGAIAGAFEEGAAAYERQDYAEALRLFRPLAEQGEAPAQFNLGLMYAHGCSAARF
jgi:uncharacterized protein